MKNNAEFDRFAKDYRTIHQENIKITGEDPDFFAKYKVDIVAKRCKKLKFAPRNILDYGAGIGNSIPHFQTVLPEAQLFCLDISRESLKIAEQNHPGAARFILADDTIPLENGSMDIVFCACVFHHIQRERYDSILKEIHRVLAQNAILFIFEHNPYNPLTVHAVNTCPLDVDARLIQARRLARFLKKAGFHKVLTRYTLFFPHCLRRLRPIEPFLSHIPLGGQYYLMGRKP